MRAMTAMTALGISAAVSVGIAATVTVAAIPPAPASTSPIQHIVVLYLENHSFDNLLGNWCNASPGRCPAGGLPTGPVILSDGEQVPITTSPMTVPPVSHSVGAQKAAMNGGLMNGWENIKFEDSTDPGCNAKTGWPCMTAYQPSQVPNITALASQFTINDRFFSMADSPSWGGHLYAVAASTGGFNGNNPLPAPGVTPGLGWGCDSRRLAGFRSAPPQPACVPDFALGLNNGGAFAPTRALYVPTIMDRLDAAGLSWRIYGGSQADASQGNWDGYQWAICPSFAECLNTSQNANLVDSGQFFTDAAAGTLPNYSIITAGGASNAGLYGGCHNGLPITACDNYVGQVASAVENSPSWGSTVLFITWDDFGGFYDQVPPSVNPDGTQQGPRLPFIAVSPYVTPGTTDDTPATMASVLAFTEHNFGLMPLEANDASAYNLSGLVHPGAAAHMARHTPMVRRPVPHVHINWAQEQQGS